MTGDRATASRWLLRAGSLADGPWSVVVDRSVDGWRHTGLRVATLGDGALDLPGGDLERIVVPLSGGCEVETTETTHRLVGRPSVFAGPTDVLYLGVGTGARVSGEGRVAVAEAPADRRLPDRLLPRDRVPVELRGSGPSSRQVHNFGVPDVLDAQRLIVCEVLTPAGNWSSYPPHKHDTATATERPLEEIYYFEAAPEAGAPAGPDADPFGLFAAYSSSAGAIEVSGMVRSGDVVLLPHGYHGPAAAAPGYDLYYLNVMAGPGTERAWLISDDPAHGWVRDQWAGQRVDPRLPMPLEEHS